MFSKFTKMPNVLMEKTVVAEKQKHNFSLQELLDTGNIGSIGPTRQTLPNCGSQPGVMSDGFTHDKCFIIIDKSLRPTQSLKVSPLLCLNY